MHIFMCTILDKKIYMHVSVYVRVCVCVHDVDIEYREDI